MSEGGTRPKCVCVHVRLDTPLHLPIPPSCIPHTYLPAYLLYTCIPHTYMIHAPTHAYLPTYILTSVLHCPRSTPASTALSRRSSLQVCDVDGPRVGSVATAAGAISHQPCVRWRNVARSVVRASMSEGGCASEVCVYIGLCITVIPSSTCPSHHPAYVPAYLLPTSYLFLHGYLYT
jgi:hypothetical protein